MANAPKAPEEAQGAPEEQKKTGDVRVNRLDAEGGHFFTTKTHAEKILKEEKRLGVQLHEIQK